MSSLLQSVRVLSVVTVAVISIVGCQRENRAVNVVPTCDPATGKDCKKPANTSDGKTRQDYDTRESEEPWLDPSEEPSSGPPPSSDPSNPSTSVPDPSDPGRKEPTIPSNNNTNNNRTSQPVPVPVPDSTSEEKLDGKLTQLGLMAGLTEEGQLTLMFPKAEQQKFTNIKSESSGSIVKDNSTSSGSTLVIGKINAKVKLNFKYQNSTCSSSTSFVAGAADAPVQTYCK